MHLPRVVVAPPDKRGLRPVRLGDQVVGAAWSARELREILVREGFPADMDLDDRALICWREVGSDTWPDRSRKRLVTAAGMAAGLVVSGAVLIIVGSEDAFGALTFASRVTGFLFFLAGLLQLAAALAVRDYWGKRNLRYSGLLVLVGVLIALQVHTMLLTLWFEEMEFTPWVFTYMPLSLWALWATWIVIREKAWQGIPHPRKVAAGVLATALLAATNFAYSAAYQPYAAHVQVTLSAKFGKPELDPREPVIHVPVTFSLQNTGRVPVNVVASVFWVKGRTSDFTGGARELAGTKEDVAGGQDSELYAGSPTWRVLDTGLIVVPGDWFDPGTGQVENVVVQVPRGADYESLEVDGDITVLRKDRGKVDKAFVRPRYSWVQGATDMVECPAECGDYVFYIGELTHNNNIINVTRRQRYVVAIRLLGADWKMYAAVSPLNAAGKVSGVNLDPDVKYGVETIRTGTVVIPFATVLKTAT
ncbi:hypothetical protein [Streptomyces sp. NBC_01353]|uniref:hypothetical protein n=1 Tax=Streptomyces sp. NBC_01353 TaxID=2903835 RepID=UPI002E2FF752|nr:hypothetical protein [Streptomyces sp. NBC_01353]